MNARELALWTAMVCLFPALVRADDTTASDRAIAAVSRLNGRWLVDETRPGKPLLKVDLGKTHADDATLAALAGVSTIRHLNLAATAITDAGLSGLAGMTALEELSLTGTGITDDGIARIKTLPNVKVLYLSSTKVTDAGLQHLRTWKQLTELHLFGTSVSATCLPSVSAMKELKVLSIANTGITLADFEAGGPKSIETLYVDTTHLTELLPKTGFQTVFRPDVPHPLKRNGFDVKLRYCPNSLPYDDDELAKRELQQSGFTMKEDRFGFGNPIEAIAIDLAGRKEIDILVSQLDNLSHLRRLKLADASVPDLAFCGSVANRLVELELRRCRINDDLLLRAHRFDKLEVLNLADSPLSDAALVALRKSPLRKLVLSNTAVTDAGLDDVVASLPQTLEELHLDCTKVTDQGLAKLVACRNLRVLKLGYTRVGDAGLASLAKLPHLTDVDLESTQVSDAGMKTFQHLPNMRSVNLARTKVTDAGLRELAGCQRLEQIDVRNLKVSLLGVAWLAKRFPQAQVIE